jgi:hypothetical protein
MACGHLGDDVCCGGIPDGKMPVRRHELAVEIKRMDFHDALSDMRLILS